MNRGHAQLPEHCAQAVGPSGDSPWSPQSPSMERRRDTGSDNIRQSSTNILVINILKLCVIQNLTCLLLAWSQIALYLCFWLLLTQHRPWEENSGHCFMNDTILSADGMSWVSILGISAIVVVVLALIFWFLNRRGHMAFMRGGSNRQPRLAVLDAAAVDSRRRLVLVRRDNVEHLILIGGPTDVVVEGGIYRAKAPQADGAKQPNPKAVARPGKPRPQPKPQQTEQQTEQPAEQQAAPAAKAIAMEPLEIPKSSEPKTPETKTPEPKSLEPKSPEPAPMPVVTRGPAAQQPSPVQKPQVVSAPQLAAVAAATATGAVASAPRSQAADEGSDVISEIATVRTGNAPAAGQMPAESAAPATRDRQNDLTAEFEEAFDAAPEIVASEPGRDVEPANGGSESESDPWLAMVAAQQKTAENASSFVAPSVGPATNQNAPSVEGILVPNPSVQAEPSPRGEAAPQKVNPEELIADFDKVLEAEISRSEKVAPEIAESEPATEADNSADGPSQSASLEDEMKKMLGDLSPKKE